MALSEHEQRILDELENQLLSDDPRMARRVANLARERAGARELGKGVGLFVVGFCLLLLLTFHPGFGVAGAAVMLAGIVIGIRAATVMANEQAQREHEPNS